MELNKAINIVYGINDSFRREGMISYAEAMETFLKDYELLKTKINKEGK